MIGASLAKKTSHLYALDPTDGSIKWAHEHTDKGRYQNSQAVIGADGTVYVAFGKGTIYAFEGQGNGSGGSVIKWQTQLPAKFEAGPIIGAEGHALPLLHGMRERSSCTGTRAGCTSAVRRQAASACPLHPPLFGR